MDYVKSLKLLSAIERAGEYVAVEAIDRFTADAVELDSQEPSPMTALLTECSNQLAVAAGEQPVVHLPRYQRLLKHVWDFALITPLAKPAAPQP